MPAAISSAWFKNKTYSVVNCHDGIHLDGLSRNVGAQDLEVRAVGAVRLEVFRSAPRRPRVTERRRKHGGDESMNTSVEVRPGAVVNISV